jgi:hypothetical protein
MKLEFSWEICKKKHSHIKLHENPSGGRQVVPCEQRERRMDGQTNMMKLTVNFRSFVKCLKMAILYASTSTHWLMLTVFRNFMPC